MLTEGFLRIIVVLMFCLRVITLAQMRIPCGKVSKRFHNARIVFDKTSILSRRTKENPQ